MGRKFKCIKSYRSGEWLTEGKIYELNDDEEITYDDGWVDNINGFFGRKDGDDYLIELTKEDEKIMEFKVGDRVKLIKDDWSNGLNGKVGTIINIINIDIGEVGIKFDNFKNGHSCNGILKDESGWNYNIKNIELYSSSNNNNQISIHITTNGTTTHAVLKDGKEVIKRASVGLYHEDEYKFETGVMEVIKKLLDVVDEKVEEVVVEEPKKFVKAKVGDTIRIINDNDSHNPDVKIGDIQVVTHVCKSDVVTNLNVFEDVYEEYEIISSLTSSPKQLSDYTTDEILEELKRRMEK